jgi:low affinity Fe/Cu permease
MMFRLAARFTGHPGHFYGKLTGAAVVLGLGWWLGKLELYMLTWTTLLTITTDLQTIVLQHAGDEDTSEIKAQVKELGRAMPGAREVIE